MSAGGRYDRGTAQRASRRPHRAEALLSCPGSPCCRVLSVRRPSRAVNRRRECSTSGRAGRCAGASKFSGPSSAAPMGPSFPTPLCSSSHATTAGQYRPLNNGLALGKPSRSRTRNADRKRSRPTRGQISRRKSSSDRKRPGDNAALTLRRCEAACAGIVNHGASAFGDQAKSWPGFERG
jgi:hypothetical protein